MRRYKKHTRFLLKRRVFLCSVILLSVFCFSFFIRAEQKDKKTDESDPHKISVSINQSQSDITVNVYDPSLKAVLPMELEEYIYYVLAAEMPASYPLEALKAQAVAARTYTLESMHIFGGDGCPSHPLADVCKSSAHCQAFASDDILKDTWGSDYAFYRTKLKNAVDSTKGEVMLYEQKPILALFHSSSADRTENVEDVYAMTLPYLRSVCSYDSPTDTPPVTLTFKNDQFAEKINSVYSGAQVSSMNLSDQIRVLSRSEGGRIKQIQTGNINLTGAQFRKLFSLNSSNFTLAFSSEKVSITTYGFGHGVGMSQNGAKQMAMEGKEYDEILKHYYNGITMGKCPMGQR